MASFRSNEANSCDLTIVCQGNEFPVHSGFICSRSAVFAAMLRHDTKEAKDRKIEIEDANSETVELFLR